MTFDEADIETLLDSVRQAESSGGKRTGPSKAGALGPYQFMPATSAQYGLATDADRMDEVKSRAAAKAYLMKLSGEFGGDLNKVLAAYNFGPGVVKNRIRQAEASGGD